MIEPFVTLAQQVHSKVVQPLLTVHTSTPEYLRLTALTLVARGVGPHESDPRAALADLGLSPTATALWRWPFAPGVDYLACATLASGTAPPPIT